MVTMSKRLPAWKRAMEALEAQGWEVEVTRVWMARARRASHVEDGIGLTREEAIEELRTQTRVDECEGCP